MCVCVCVCVCVHGIVRDIVAVYHCHAHSGRLPIQQCPAMCRGVTNFDFETILITQLYVDEIWCSRCTGVTTFDVALFLLTQS